MSETEIKRNSLIERRRKSSTKYNESLISIFFQTDLISPKLELIKLTNPVFFALRAGDLSSTNEHIPT